MRVSGACVCLMVLAVGQQAAAGGERREAYACATRADVVGPCVTLRGRLSFWNGVPSARIWPVGTRRLLGVRHDVLPPALVGWMNTVAPQRGSNPEVWAIFTVCPLTRDEVGHMQFVCIDAWRAPSLRARGE